MKSNKITEILLLARILSFLCGSLGSYLILKTQDTNQDIIIPTKNYNSIKLIESNSISEGVKNVYDSVVVVEGFTKNQLASTGTGFIYKKTNDTAYIMTNHHVINGVESVKIILSDKTVIDAKIKGSEAYSDIAVLAVPSEKIKHVATLGDSNKLNVGDTLFTVGSPEGSEYAGTVTKGVLSGKDRLVAVALSNSQSSDYYMRVLQTDAAINPGNSGGPICNINGEVIGITNMKLVDDTVEGMGFAIPIEDALEVAEILETEGEITRPYVGIEMLDLSNELNLWKAGILIPEGVESGIVVYSVASSSPAAKAGLEKGDIIIKLADKDIESLADFRYELYKHSPNSEVEITYIREGKEKTTKITLGKSE